MIFADSAGRLRTIIGYPTRDIAAALREPRPWPFRATARAAGAPDCGSPAAARHAGRGAIDPRWAPPRVWLGEAGGVTERRFLPSTGGQPG